MRMLALLALLLAACRSPTATSAPDASVVEQDGGIDAGDVAPIPDAGPPDAGPPDAGPEDAGVDAGEEVDGGFGDFVEAEPFNPPASLCDIPPGYVANGGDPAHIACAVATDRFTDRNPYEPHPFLKIVAWNVEFGKESAKIVDALKNDPHLQNADFLLLSEVARGSLTSNPQNLDQARDVAQQLHMNYAFAVEWDRREKPTELGEHGVAVLSKYPLGNFTQLRLTALNNWYDEDQLYGGRIALGVDAWVAGTRVRLYVAHLCTRGTLDQGRAAEAAEIRIDADMLGRPAVQVVGGDLNTWNCNPLATDCTHAPNAEQTVRDFLAAGWADGTAGFNGVSQIGAGFFPQRLDWIFTRGAHVIPGTSAMVDGSDHLPLYTTIELP